MSQAVGESNYFFFLSDQKTIVKDQGNIYGFSRQRELYNRQKWALKYLKINMCPSPQINSLAKRKQHAILFFV